jgi:hypothetical protein
LVEIKQERERDCILKNELKKFKENLKDAETNLNKFEDYLKKQLNLGDERITVKHIIQLNENIPVLKLIPIKDRGFLDYNEYIEYLKTPDAKTKKVEENIVKEAYHFDYSHLSKTAYEETIKVNEKIARDEKNLYAPFILALTENRVDFVNLFLQNGLDIKKFLTAELLRKMYFNTEVFSFIVYIFLL